MAKYINTDVLEVVGFTDQEGSFSDGVQWLLEYIDALPSADVQPVRKGCFIGTEYDGYADGSPVFYEWKCSECGCIFEDEEPTYNYCPNCGADMRGEG